MDEDEICNILADTSRVSECIEAKVGKMSPEELASSRGELFKKILRIRAKLWAEKYLEDIRNESDSCGNPVDVDGNIESIKSLILEAGVTLEEIGTSEEELQELRLSLGIAEKSVDSSSK